MGTIPNAEFQLSFGYDNNVLSAPIVLVDNKATLPVKRAHYPHRIGMNQRSKSVSIRLESTQLIRVNGAGVANPYDFLEISNMRLLWTPTNRDAKYASLSNVT